MSKSKVGEKTVEPVKLAGVRALLVNPDKSTNFTLWDRELKDYLHQNYPEVGKAIAAEAHTKFEDPVADKARASKIFEDKFRLQARKGALRAPEDQGNSSTRRGRQAETGSNAAASAGAGAGAFGGATPSEGAPQETPQEAYQRELMEVERLLFLVQKEDGICLILAEASLNLRGFP